MSFVHLSYLKTIVYQPEPILQIILKNCPSGWCNTSCQGRGVTHFHGELTKWYVHSSKVVFCAIILKFSVAAFCSELLSSPQNCSECHSESLLLFLFHGTEIRVAFSSTEGFGTEFRVVVSSAEGFGTEFRDFLFRGTAGIPSEITICSVYSVFRGIIFLSEIPNPRSVVS